MELEPVETLLGRALAARANWIDERHENALRLFNGFLEGDPGLVVELYARSLVIYNYAANPAEGQARATTAQEFFLAALPWLQAVILKTRAAPDEAARSGVVSFGTSPDRSVRENGVWYAVDLLLNADSSLYLDTRHLRAWASEHLGGKRVLNTFAYTGSLGVAAQAGGAARVVQLDLNRRFLNLAKDSYTLNGFPIHKSDFIAGDFWVQAARLKNQGALFDCVFIDPPFFSVTSAGRVDLVGQAQRVINKVRPLVGHDGWLVTINNAVFVSGREYYGLLENLCADGYLSIEELLPVPADFTGFPETRVGQPPADPAPFNHSTKIAILRVKRKDLRVI
jgi:23S rRNA (cytosine1962-C5)-methyltransferase